MSHLDAPDDPEPKAAPTPAYLKSQRTMRINHEGRHPSGHCIQRDCPTMWESTPTTYTEALDHAQETGHAVTLEETTVITMEVYPT